MPALFPASDMRFRLLALALLLPLLSACGFNTIPTAEEQARAAWSEVLNQYQRRAELIPNLVETVKGYAAHEREVLEGVVEARARATLRIGIGRFTSPADVDQAASALAAAWRHAVSEDRNAAE